MVFKKTCTSLSITEAEYIGAATSMCDLINIQRLCSEFYKKMEGILYVGNGSVTDILDLLKTENELNVKTLDTILLQI